MRFDLGTLDSGERSLPFGLLVGVSCFSLSSMVITSHGNAGAGCRSGRLLTVYVHVLCFTTICIFFLFILVSEEGCDLSLGHSLEILPLFLFSFVSNNRQ